MPDILRKIVANFLEQPTLAYIFTDGEIPVLVSEQNCIFTVATQKGAAFHFF